jgi:hypothetical protein
MSMQTADGQLAKQMLLDANQNEKAQAYCVL